MVALEESADRLGAALMDGIRKRSNVPVEFVGVGGSTMLTAGLVSLYPTDDFSVIGFTAIPQRLPLVLKRMWQTVNAVRRKLPDALVLIDSPTYNLPVARLVRRAAPTIPIIGYVSPPVWAWRFNRATSMRNRIDRVLALLPFEPEAHRALGGPPCSYVGHPVIEELDHLRPNAAEAQRRLSDPPVVLVMPGSRSHEIRRMAPISGAAIERLSDQSGPINFVLPTFLHLRELVTDIVANWKIKPRIVFTLEDKEASIRIAAAALTKCGTGTLELALAGVPMVAAYRLSAFEAFVLRRLVKAPAYALPNLILQKTVVPEVVHDDCTPARLAAELGDLVYDTAPRRRQIEAFAELDRIMEVGLQRPAFRAADQILAICSTARRRTDDEAANAEHRPKRHLVWYAGVVRRLLHRLA